MFRHLKDALEDFRAALQPPEASSEGAATTEPSEPPPIEALAQDATPEPSMLPATDEGQTSEITLAPEPLTEPITTEVQTTEVASVVALTPNTNRWRRWPWLEIAAVMIVAVVILWRWVPWQAREPADPKVVATYQGGTVTREQLKQQFQSIPKQEQPYYRSTNGLRALVGDVVSHEVTRRWAEEKQVDQKQMFKEAMKHATENIQIADVSEQLHQGRIQVGEAEIQAYYDQNRQQFGERPLTEVRNEIRQAVVEQKEQGFVENYLKDLKERASLQVNYSLLDVPEQTEPELLGYYEVNRARFRMPEQAKVAQIQVSMSLAGGDDKARTKAETTRARAAAGEDFAQLAGEVSDGPEKAAGGNWQTS